MKRPVYAVLLLSVATGVALGFGQAVELSSNRAAEVDAVLVQDCIARHAASTTPMAPGQLEEFCRQETVARRQPRRQAPHAA
jgi:hypothetical protein